MSVNPNVAGPAPTPVTASPCPARARSRRDALDDRSRWSDVDTDMTIHLGVCGLRYDARCAERDEKCECFLQHARRIPRDVKTSLALLAKANVNRYLAGKQLCSAAQRAEPQQWLPCCLPPAGPRPIEPRRPTTKRSARAAACTVSD